uniref:Uncharacterized protein n=1 Tax=Helicotheca tamesis TaxID=374047 RepID=A0A7S2GSZ3_9STRA
MRQDKHTKMCYRSGQAEDSETHTTVDWSANSSLSNSLHSQVYHADDDFPITPPPTQYYPTMTTKTSQKKSPSKLVINVTHHLHTSSSQQEQRQEEPLSPPPSPCPTEYTQENDDTMIRSTQTYTSFHDLGIIMAATTKHTIPIHLPWKFVSKTRRLSVDTTPQTRIGEKDCCSGSRHWWMKLSKSKWWSRQDDAKKANTLEDTNHMKFTASPYHSKQSTPTTIDLNDDYDSDDEEEEITTRVFVTPPPPISKTACNAVNSYVSFRDLMDDATTATNASSSSLRPCGLWWWWSCPSWQSCKY